MSCPPISIFWGLSVYELIIDVQHYKMVIGSYEFAESVASDLF